MAWWIPLATTLAGAMMSEDKDKKNSAASKRAEAEARAHNEAAARMKYIQDFETRPYVQGQDADPTGSMMQGALAGFTQGQAIEQGLERYGQKGGAAQPNTFQGYTPPEQAYQNPTQNAILDKNAYVDLQNAGSTNTAYMPPNSYQDPMMKAQAELERQQIEEGYNRDMYYNSHPGTGKAQTNARTAPDLTGASQSPYFLLQNR
jgi:hypothetical protein